MNESGNIFYDEVMDKLQHMEDALLDVQGGVYDDENVNEIFRSIHTVKGTADLLGMLDVVNITHKAEDLMVEVRDGNVELDDELCFLLIELKKFIVILVDSLLNGIEIDDKIKELLIGFEKELFKYMPKPKNLKTILVLDDSFVVREQIKKIVQDKGYIAITATNSTDGLDKFNNNDIDLIFCDIDTPLIDGLGMIKKIKSESQYESLPVVLLVAAKTSDLQKIGQETGAKAWVLKPIVNDKIKVILEKLLNS